MTDMNNAMKADYLRILSENKKLKQQIANVEKEIAHLKGMIPKDDPIELEVHNDE